MKQVKQIADTVAVILTDLLNFRVTGWKAAKAKAAEMNEAYASSVEFSGTRLDVEDGEGNLVVPEVAMTPLRALGNRLLLIAGLAILAYGAVKMAAAVGSIMIALLFAAIVLGAVNTLFNKVFGAPRRPAEEAVQATTTA